MNITRHICYFARWLSPRAASCYPFEDYVGKVQRSALACVRGTPMHLVAAKASQNILLATYFALRDSRHVQQKKINAFVLLLLNNFK